MPEDSDQYDFFVSYAHADNENGWITGFVNAVIEEHRIFTGGCTLTPFFDQEEIRSLDDWQHRIYDGLAASRLFMAFVSPGYFASQWCRREWRTWIDLEIAKHILSSGVAPVYIIKVPGFEGKETEEEVARRLAGLCGYSEDDHAFVNGVCPLIKQMRNRQFNAVQPFYNEGLTSLQKEDLRKILKRLAEDVDQKVEFIKNAAKSANTVPPYNKCFSGRLDELHSLRKRMNDDRAGVITGIHGLGGVGKTELAFAYAHAYAGVYPGGRFLVPCDQRSSLREAIIQLGDFEDFQEQIDVEQRKTPDAHFKAICGYLRKRIDSRGRILLVLDNVSDPALLFHEQTDELTSISPQLHLLATTRLRPPSADEKKWFTLGELPETHALDLLEKHRPFKNEEEREAAEQIVHQLGGFVLAVELVAAWMRKHPEISWVDMANGLKLEDLEILAGDAGAELRRHNHEKRLEAILGPILDSLSLEELRTMQYAAYLAPDAAPLEWLKELITKENFPELGQKSRLYDPWVNLCRHLSDLALLIRPEQTKFHDPEISKNENTTNTICRVHRLVQDMIIERMIEEERKERSEAVSQHIKRRDKVLEETTNWQESRWELEPLEALARRWDEENHEDPAWLLGKVGMHWYNLAEWSRAEPLMRRGLEIDEVTYGPDHPEVSPHLNNLAVLLQDTNRLAESESFMRQALEIAEKTYGPDHPEVAIVLNNLVALLRITNRFYEAEPLIRRAIEINEKAYGPDHPEVAIVLNNLAGLLRATNRLSKAEPFMRRVIRIFEKSYGKNHPNVAIVLSNLAGLLKATDRISEAEPLYRRALEISEKAYGRDHPQVATDLNNLATLFYVTNRLSEAEPLYRRALQIDEKAYGPDHRTELARDLSNLAQLLKATNRFSEAESHMLCVISIYEKSYGNHHPNVATGLNNLAGLLEATNRISEAEPLYRRALEIVEKAYGKDHPTVATYLNNLGILLCETERIEEGLPMIRRGYTIFRDSLGEEHPNTKTVLEALEKWSKTKSNNEQKE